MLITDPPPRARIGAIAAVHDNVRPETREMLRDAAADAGGRAGHDRHLAREFVTVHGIRTDLMTRPSCMASNASRQPSSAAVRPTIFFGCVTPRASRWITRSQTG